MFKLGIDLDRLAPIVETRADKPLEAMCVEAAELLSVESTSGAMAREPRGAQDESGVGYLERIASKLKIPKEIAEHVFNQEGDVLEIVVAPGKLEKKNSAATKQLAILTVAGHQAAGIEDWTSTSVIRQWCEHFKKLDSANFAATIKELENLFTMRGTARGRQMRTTAPGWVEASRLVSQLGGGD
ncbi:MAG: hypothetical protein E6J14_06180 [Chloroflexi bacterium]|nr:MAG: hypothetical protein E6J14_06180 [Chloroflexota bacterium]